jgi:hypothetical protein
VDERLTVTKRHVFEPSAFDPPDQDQYEYWIYEFQVEGREYVVRRYTDEPDRATILSNVRNADEQALADAVQIARYLIEREGVATVFRYDTKTGVFGRKVEPAAE